MTVSMLHENALVLWRPDAALATLLFGCTYFAVIGPLRIHVAGAAGASKGQIAAITTVLINFYIAMGPLSLLAERYLFTAYILQMLLLTQVLPPLLFLATPTWLQTLITTTTVVRKIVRVGSSPLVAPLLYNVLATFFLLPTPLHAILSNNVAHLFAQCSLTVSAFFLWWPLMSRVPSLPQLTSGAQLLYLLFAANFMMPIVVFLFISQTPWYPLFAFGAPKFGVSPLGDQQIGALLMAVGMIGVFALRALRPFLSHSDSVWYQ